MIPQGKSVDQRIWIAALLLVFPYSTWAQTAFTPQTYGMPVKVQTKYGDITFSAIKLWDFLGARNDDPAPGDRVFPVFLAEVDNQTATEWHVPQFKVDFKCPGEASARTYVEVLGTIKVGRSVVADRTPPGRSESPCNAEAISITLIVGDNDRDRSQREEQARRELETAKAAEKRRQEDEERMEAAAEQQRIAVRRAAEAKLRAKQEADRLARSAYLAQFPMLENGAEAIFIGSDRKCSEQFIQATRMDGLEKRKQIADLVTYGCGFVDSRGVHVKRIRNEGAYCLVSPIEGKHQMEAGWVPCSWIGASQQ